MGAMTATGRHPPRSVATMIILLTGLAWAVPAEENKLVAAPATQPAQGRPEDGLCRRPGHGQRLRDEMLRDGLTADNDLIVRGLVDGLNDLPSLYPEDEMMAAIAKIEATIRTRRAEKLVASDPSVRKLCEANLRRSRMFLEQNAKMTGVEILPGGVQSASSRPGTARSSAIRNGSSPRSKSPSPTEPSSTPVRTTSPAASPRSASPRPCSTRSARCGSARSGRSASRPSRLTASPASRRSSGPIRRCSWTWNFSASSNRRTWRK